MYETDLYDLALSHRRVPHADTPKRLWLLNRYELRIREVDAYPRTETVYWVPEFIGTPRLGRELFETREEAALAGMEQAMDQINDLEHRKALLAQEIA